MREQHPESDAFHNRPATVVEGDRLFRCRDFARAVAAYEIAAERHEIPPAELCAKLARGLVEIDRPVDACEWALKVVDGATSYSSWSAAASVIERCGAQSIPRIRHHLRVGIIGTWTTSAFVSLFKLAAARVGIAAEVYEAPFGQYFNETLDAGSPLFGFRPQALILCPDHRALGVPSYSDDLEGIVDASVQRWSGVWKAARQVAPVTIVQHSFAVPGGDWLGHLASGLDGSRRSISMEINRRLALRAADEDVGLVDVDALAARFGKDVWFDDRNWHLAKVALAPAALPLLAQHTAAVLASRLGLSRRCLVLDLDNTLWGGVIGDDGVGGLTLGEGPQGEAFVDFQQAIKELSTRGIVLAVCSKNELQTAQEPFVSHPEMVLKLDDIAAFAANWRSKSENLVEIARTLNLGLDALTFVDDNPYERSQVRQALPQVDVLTLPEDPTGYRRALEEYPFFEPPGLTAEDRTRAQQYQGRARAEALRQSVGSLEEYQASLGMVATIGPIDDANMARVVQLINKTNQFNVTTRRRNRAEVEVLLAQSGVEHFWVRLRDRFADHGLIGVVIATFGDDCLEIDTLLMSCRVIGRGVEEVMRDELIERARRRRCAELRGVYLPTPRNKPVSELFERLGFAQLQAQDGRSEWSLPLVQDMEGRAAIKVERPVESVAA